MNGRMTPARALAAMAVLVTLLVAAGPHAARAEWSPTSPPPPPTWNAAACATAAITGHQALSGSSSANIAIQGWIAPCAPPQDAWFAIIRFHRDAGVLVWWGQDAASLRPYLSPTAPTAFDVTTLDVPGLSATYGPLHAMCVARAPEDRLACVAVEYGADGQPTTVDIPVDDARVMTPLRYYLLDDGDVINPVCGTCV